MYYSSCCAQGELWQKAAEKKHPHTSSCCKVGPSVKGTSLCRVTIAEETSPEKPSVRKAPEARQNAVPTPRANSQALPPKAEPSREASVPDSAADSQSNAPESAPSTPRRQPPPPQAPSARHDPSTTAPQQVLPPLQLEGSHPSELLELFRMHKIACCPQERSSSSFEATSCLFSDA